MNITEGQKVAIVEMVAARLVPNYQTLSAESQESAKEIFRKTIFPTLAALPDGTVSSDLHSYRSVLEEVAVAIFMKDLREISFFADMTDQEARLMIPDDLVETSTHHLEQIMVFVLDNFPKNEDTEAIKELIDGFESLDLDEEFIKFFS